METQDSTLIDSDVSSPFNSSVRRRQDRDRHELASVGKKEVLQRNFGFLSILGFSSILLGTYEAVLNTLQQGLITGGPAGLIYGFLIVWTGMLAVAACLAEMASMAPIAGGQYYWVAMLSPHSCGKVLSYVNGFLSVTVWQLTFATGGLVTGSVIESLIILNNPDAAYSQWHVTLLFYGFVFLALFVNTYLIKWLPALEGLILIFYVLGFFAILIPLVYLSRSTTASTIFTSFYNATNWNPTLAFFIGIPISALAFLGIDTAAHLAEEVQDASTTVPRSLVATVALNGALGFGMLVAVLSSIDDLDTVLSSVVGYSFIAIFAQSAGIEGGIIMATILLVLLAAANVSFLATAARILWAFARDNGLPWSFRLAQINPRTSLPLYAIGTTTIISLLLALVNIASVVAFSGLLSGTLSGYLATLLLPCSLLLYRRLKGDIGERAYQDYDAVPNDSGHTARLRWGPWRMNAAMGLIVNLYACVFLTTLFLFTFFPLIGDGGSRNANYASAVFGSTIIIALVYYFLRGRKSYLKPLAKNRRWLQRRGKQRGIDHE